MAKAKFTHDVMATIGTYKDAEGNKKKRYMRVGAAFTNDDGNISIKMDAQPCGPNWSGWLSLMKPRDEGERQQSRASRPAPPIERDDQDIPF